MTRDSPIHPIAPKATRNGYLLDRSIDFGTEANAIDESAVLIERQLDPACLGEKGRREPIIYRDLLTHEVSNEVRRNAASMPSTRGGVA